MTASILTIGDEILIGQIIDTNSTWLGEQLFLSGVEVERMLAIADTEQAIVQAIQMAFETSDLVITTGGLGPTKDDITKKAIAQFLDVGMYFDPGVFEKLKAIFANFGRQTNDSHKEQCFMPEGVQLLDNKMGTAPGMLFQHGKKYLLSMPGVPYEMKWIFENSFLETHLKAWGKKFVQVNKTIQTVGVGETTLEEQIAPVINNFSKELSMSYLPSLGKVRLRINGRGKDGIALEEKVNDASLKIKELLGDVVFGEDDDTLESAVIHVFRENKKTIGTAESCTGGNIAKRITSIAGSSDVFQGSIVSYSNKLKEQLLEVPLETLQNYGAVSEETVRAMVKGGIKALGVDVVVAVSGIAGPGGGSVDKPVGTIWLACGDLQEIRTKKLNLSKNRLQNIEYTSNTALNMLRRYFI